MKTFYRLSLFIVAVLVLIAPFSFLPPKKRVLEDVAEPIAVSDVEEVKKPVIKPVIPEKPLHNIALPEFDKIQNVTLKKRAFFEYLKPAIIDANNHLLSLRAEIKLIAQAVNTGELITNEQKVFVDNLIKQYRIKGVFSLNEKLEQLLMHVDIVPIELVLVQAANESAWGTSRFARIGLNFFGLWCYKKGCGMVPSSRTQGLKHEVAAFKSIEHAVARYLYNINSNNAYKVFRIIRAQLREQAQPLSPVILATGLLPYSERGVEYVSDLLDMLRHNANYIRSSI